MGARPAPRRSFGACAEQHGVEEVNFTFEGHPIARHRGVRVLNHEELQNGDVSLAYVARLLNRRYTDSPTIRKVLQTLWYQINNGQEIYVVGTILGDGTDAAAPGGEPSSPSCATSPSTCSIRTKTAGFGGLRARHGSGSRVWPHP